MASVGATGEIVLAVQWQNNNADELTRFTGRMPEPNPYGLPAFGVLDPTTGAADLCVADGVFVPVPVKSWVVRTPNGWEVLTDAAFRKRFNEKKAS